jgi:hypothetical protein
LWRLDDDGLMKMRPAQSRSEAFSQAEGSAASSLSCFFGAVRRAMTGAGGPRDRIMSRRKQEP